MPKYKDKVLAVVIALGVAPMVACSGDQPQPCSGPGSCQTSPSHVAIEVDASPSGPDGQYFWKAFINQLEARAGQYLVVDVMAIGATADSQEQGCPTVSGQAVGAEADADDPELSWKRSARALVAAAKPVFECAETAESMGSAVLAFEQARGADELWLFSDAMFNTEQTALRAGKLADAEYVNRVIKGLPGGDALGGVSVSVFGAGVGQALSNEQMAGLKAICYPMVEAQGGTITTWKVL